RSGRNFPRWPRSPERPTFGSPRARLDRRPALERHVVVVARARRRRLGSLGNFARGARPRPVLSASEHHDVGCPDLGFVPLLPVLVLPAPGLEAALNVDLLSFLQILAADLSELLPRHDVVPLGALLLGARGVLPGGGGREREARERGPLRGRPDLR